MGKPIRNIVHVRRDRRSISVSVVIIADKAGHRMKSYGPTPLINIDKKRLIDHQIYSTCKHLKVKEIILIVGFKASQIIKNVPKNISVIKNTEYETNNVVQSMAIGTDASTTDNILFLDGGVFTSKKAFSKFQPKFSQLFLQKNDKKEEDVVGSVIEERTNEVENSLFSISKTHWHHILFLTGLELELFKTFYHDIDKQRWFGFEATNKIADMGGSIQAYYPVELIVNINHPRQIGKMFKNANNSS